MYEAGGDSGVTVNSYALTSTRGNSSATWANQPTISSTVLGTCKSTGTIGNKVTMNMTKFVQELCNGTRSYNYGIMMKSTSETNKKYAKFYGVRFTTSGKRPTLVVNYVDGPTTATSVSASPNYIKKSGTTKVTWAGINTSYLSYVQYRIQKNGAEDNLVNYSSGTKIGTTGSGSANITLGSWADGTYRIYVRGVDKGGIKGVGKGVSVVIDSTNPVFDKNSVSPVTSASAYSKSIPTMSWKVTDTNFRDVYYSIDQGNTWKKLSTAKEGSAALPAADFKKTGTYRIFLRAYDKAGNYKTSAGMDYYYDNTAPKAGTVTRSTDGTNILISLYGLSEIIDTEKVYYAVSADGADKPAETSYIPITDLSYKDNNLTVKVPIDSKLDAENVYDIYVAMGDKAGNISYDNPIKAGWYNIKNAVYDGSLILSADKNEENPTDDWYLFWNTGDSASGSADSVITSADIYESLDGNTFKKIGTNTTGQQVISVPEMKNYVSYRIIATYKNGSKRLSNIQSLQKTALDEYVETQEQELGASISEEDVDELVAMDAVAVKEESPDIISGKQRAAENIAEEYVYLNEEIDTDGDQLLDGYEMWEIGSDKTSADSDTDGFDDYYEVTVLGASPAIYTADGDNDKDGVLNSKEKQLGTNPYLPDTDFDGVNDSSDKEPLKTNTGNGAAVSYSIIENNNIYEHKISKTEEGLTFVYWYNPYSDLIRKIERSTEKNGKVQEYYFYDSKKQQIGLLRNYGNNKYDVVTSTYDENDEVNFAAYNGLGYTINRNDEGDLLSVAVNGVNLINNSFAVTGTGEDAYTYQSKAWFANNQGETYDYTQINVTDADGNVSKEKALKGVKIDGASAYSYEYAYDSQGNVQNLKDNENNVQYTYEYDSQGEVAGITASNGFKINKQKDSDTGDQKRTYSFGNVQHSVAYTESGSDTSTKKTSVIDTDLSVEEQTDSNSKNDSKVIKFKNNLILENKQVLETNQLSLNLKNNRKLLYKYDTWGNIASISYSDGNSTAKNYNAEYEYNTKGELTSETNSFSDTNKKYEYDGNGNRVSKKEYDKAGKLVKTGSFTYDAVWRDKIAGYTENGVKKSISFDTLGNPINWINDLKFTWKNGRRLNTAENPEYSVLYKYDVTGLRTQKKVTEKAGNISTTYDYIWDGNAFLRETRTTGQNKLVFDYLYDGNYNIIGFKLSGNGIAEKIYIFEQDVQGNIVAVYELGDESAACVAEYAYDAFGELVKVTNNTNDNIGDLNLFRYRGYYQDVETNLYYLQSRYYDASAGRFLNMDNILYLGVNPDIYNCSYNLFVYCENDPVNYVDETGYKPAWPKVWKVIKKYIGWSYKDQYNRKQIFYWGYYSPQSFAGYNDLYDRLSGFAGCNLASNKVERKISNTWWRIQFWKGSYAYDWMYGAEIGIYYKKSNSSNHYFCAKKYPLKMSYSIYKQKKRLFTTRTETTWWKNGFVRGYQHRNNLTMVSKIYFPTSSIGNSQKKAFDDGKGRLKNCEIYPKGRMYTIIWNEEGNVR